MQHAYCDKGRIRLKNNSRLVYKGSCGLLFDRCLSAQSRLLPSNEYVPPMLINTKMLYTSGTIVVVVILFVNSQSRCCDIIYQLFEIIRVLEFNDFKFPPF